MEPVLASFGGQLVALVFMVSAVRILVLLARGNRGGQRRSTGRKRLTRGEKGEACVDAVIHSELDDGIYTPISDIMLPAKNGTTQIDHVVVSRYGVFVIETKDYGGWIFGGEDQAKWTQVFYSRKSQFQNPLRQNYRHTKTLSELTHIPHHYFKSVVVFAGDATFKTEMPDNVVYVGDLARHIEGFEKYVIRDEQVPDVASAIREWAGTVSPEDERLHVEMLRKRMRPPAEGESPDCPKCGNPMTMRTNRSDNSRFWGCSGYPRCRGTRSVA